MRSKPILNNPITVTIMISFSLLLLILITTLLNFCSSLPSLTDPITKTRPDPFTDLLSAFNKWDAQMGCSRFKEKYCNLGGNGTSSLQVGGEFGGCVNVGLKQKHVSVLVKGWTWIPDNMENLYSCNCGLSCFWSKSHVLVDFPDALLFETSTPPLKRSMVEPLRVYMDLEPGRNGQDVRISLLAITPRMMYNQHMLESFFIITEIIMYLPRRIMTFLYIGHHPVAFQKEITWPNDF